MAERNSENRRVCRLYEQIHTQNENENHLDFMIDQVKVHQQKSKQAN